MTTIALFKEIDQAPTFVAPFDSNSFAKIEALKNLILNISFLIIRFCMLWKHLVKALEQAGWTSNDVLVSILVLLGELLYLKTPQGIFGYRKAQTLASPTTTLGISLRCMIYKAGPNFTFYYLFDCCMQF
jgi:hypothetical protein